MMCAAFPLFLFCFCAVGLLQPVIQMGYYILHNSTEIEQKKEAYNELLVVTMMMKPGWPNHP